MKTLIWKEFRQNRQTLVASLILVSLPYVGVLLAVVYQTLRGLPPEVARNFEFASGSSIWISVLFCAFLAANTVAGERVDRSAEFVSYVPIPRTLALTSKLITALIGNFLLLVVNGSVFLLTVWFQGMDTSIVFSSNALGIVVATATLLFCTSWLLSNLVRTPSIAAGGSVVGLITILVTLMMFEEAYPGVNYEGAFIALCLSIGLVCLHIGAIHFLRRVEP